MNINAKRIDEGELFWSAKSWLCVSDIFDKKREAHPTPLTSKEKQELLKENIRKLNSLDITMPKDLGEVILPDYEGLTVKAPEKEIINQEVVNSEIEGLLEELKEKLIQKGFAISGKICLTDKLAHKLDNSCETADEYRELIRKRLLDEAEAAFRFEKRICALNAIKEKSDIKVTDAALRWVTNVLVKECCAPSYERFCNQSFLKLLTSGRASLEEFNTRFLDDEVKDIAECVAIIEAISKKEKIELTDSGRKEYAKKQGCSIEEYIKLYGPEYLDIFAKRYVVMDSILERLIFV